MPVHRQKKDTTPTPPSSTLEQPAPELPDQQTFRQYLRELARGAIRVVVEDVMRQELDALIGVGWGESSPKRKGHRNGFYSRDLVTSSGRQEHWRVLYLDGVHFSIRHGDKADSTIILTALGVDLAGNKEVLALRACAEENKEGWGSLLQDLRTRGATQIDLIVTDGHDGLLAAVSELFSATPRQRCLVHKQRNVLSAIPRRERGEVQAELVGIWEQPTKQEALIHLAAFKAKYPQRYPEAVRSLAEDEEHLLTFYALTRDDAPTHSKHQCH